MELLRAFLNSLAAQVAFWGAGHGNQLGYKALLPQLGSSFSQASP